jgi:UDP-N-acetylenolpyruvoylglucosamine reductase
MCHRRPGRFGFLKNTSRVVRMLEEASGCQIEENVPLASLTSFHIGGPAALFVEASSVQALAALLRVSNEHGIEPLILGGGTNLLVSDGGFEGLAIRLSVSDEVIDPERRFARAGAGVPTADLIWRTLSMGLAGLEFAAGLPGTVGGGLSGNAGCFGSCLSDRLERATVVSPRGKIIDIDHPAWFSFGYRHSSVLENGFVIADATFRLSTGDRAELEDEASKHLALRRQKHPAKDIFTAGSYFKNLLPLEPEGRRRAAGLLLDQVGARDLTVGDAAVFERHANIVINRGKARAEDVLALADEMKRRVKERFGIDLIPEVRFVGERSPT